MKGGVLVVAAFAPELAALPLPFGASNGAAHESARGPVRAKALGVGPLAAAAALGDLLARESPEHVVFVGTAGVFPSSAAAFPLSSVAVAGSTELVDVAVLRGLAERPHIQTCRFDLDAELAAAIAGEGSSSRRARVATTTAVTVSDALAEEIGAAGFDLEHLELAAVAAACAAHGHAIRCAAIFGVANGVGARGREEWRTHHAAAASAACDRLARWLWP